jgi:hypothetical protein
VICGNSPLNFALDLLAPRLQPGNPSLVTVNADHQPAHAGMKTHKVGEFPLANPNLTLNLPDVPRRNAPADRCFPVGLGLRTFDFQHPTGSHKPIWRHPNESKASVWHKPDLFNVIPGLPRIPRTCDRLMVDTPLHRRRDGTFAAMPSYTLRHQFINEGRVGARIRGCHGCREPRTRDPTEARLVPLW